MNKITAAVPSSHQKDGVAALVIEFDNDTDGWYLYGHADFASASLFDFWNMTKEDALQLAESDWGVPQSIWQSAEDNASGAQCVDCNGTVLQNGDDITVIKDLEVKGAGQTVKRGTTVKNISLTDDPELIDCRTKDIKGLVLKTCFVKKL
jgi:protein PhnA